MIADRAGRRRDHLFHTAGTPPDQDGSLGEVGGNCNACHVGPLFTGAAAPVVGLVFKAALASQFDPVTDTVICTAHEFSFFGIGTRPVDHDIVMGGEDPYGNPLPFGRQYWNRLEAGEPDPDSAAGREILVDRFDPADSTLMIRRLAEPPSTSAVLTCR
jgi:hypothetical protein